MNAINLTGNDGADGSDANRALAALATLAASDDVESRDWARRVLARIDGSQASASMAARAVGGVSMLVVALAVLLSLIVLAGGCSPGMHRAYQRTMAGAASGLYLLDGAQTSAAMRSGDAAEANPIIVQTLGAHPSAGAIWTIAGVQAAGVPLLTLIPGSRPADDTGEYLKDGILTCLVAIQAFTVKANADTRHTPFMSSWH